MFLCPIKNDSSYSCFCQTKCSVIKIKKVYLQLGGWFAFFDINCSLKMNFAERHFILVKYLLWVLFFFFLDQTRGSWNGFVSMEFCHASKLSNFSPNATWLCFWLTLVSVQCVILKLLVFLHLFFCMKAICYILLHLQSQMLINWDIPFWCYFYSLIACTTSASFICILFFTF